MSRKQPNPPPPVGCRPTPPPAPPLPPVRSEPLLASDHEALMVKFCAYRDALDYCLSCLKHHHMTKRGISALVTKTEQIKRKANNRI